MTFTIFYLSTEKTPLLEAAFNASLDYENICSEFISKEDVLNLSSVKENCTFVLSHFDREPFFHLSKLTTAIYGPQVILHYLREGKALPVWQSPLYSTALINACVSVTSITTDLRDKLSEKIKMLHGRYSKDLTEKVNVIITTKVGSKKYLVGADRGIKMVLPEWVDEAMVQSISRDPIDFMSEIVLDQFKTPTFSKLSITVSGIPGEDRMKIAELIRTNGGEYDSELVGKKTTHLIINKAGGAKYEFAKKWKLQIVSLDWLLKSIEKGYSLNEDNFRLEETNMFSTPCKTDKAPSLPNGDLSCIPHDIGISKIAESRLDSTAIKGIFHEFHFKFVNTQVNEIQKLRPIILSNGGKIADSISEAVTSDITHVLVGNMNPNYFVSYAMPNVEYLKVNWIEKCMELMKIAPMDEYRVQTSDQKEMDELNKIENFSKLTATGLDDGNDDLLSLLDQYAESQPTIQNSHDFISPSNMEIKKLFLDNTHIYLSDELNSYQTKLCRDKVKSENGIIVEEPSKAKIKVYPFFTSKPIVNSKNDCVTWCGLLKHIETKLSLKRLLEDNFLYNPIEKSSNDLPLKDKVFSITGFMGDERNWVSEYLIALGAHIQDSLLRRDMPEKNLRACNYLLVKFREGKKHDAALKWELPVVDLAWLEKTGKDLGNVNLFHGEILGKSKINVEDFSSWSSTTGIEKENLPPSPPKEISKNDVPVKMLKFSDKLIMPNDSLREEKTPKASVRKHLNESICDTPVSAFLTAGVPYIPKNLVKGNIDDMFKTPEWMKQAQKNQPEKDWRDIDLATVLVWDASDFDGQKKNPIENEEPEKDASKDITLNNISCNTPVQKSRKEPAESPLPELPTEMSLPNHVEPTPLSSTTTPVAIKPPPPVHSDSTFNPVQFNYSTPICEKKKETSEAHEDHEKSIVQTMNSKLKEILSSNKASDESVNELETSSVRARRKRCLDSESGTDEKDKKKFRKVDSNEKNKVGDVFWKYEDHSQPNMASETTSPVLKKPVDELEKTKFSETQPKKNTQEVKEMGFSFLNISPGYKEKLEATVINLGSRIVENDSFAEQATHLIASNPVRNERYLIALATGKWILHPSYIEACESSSKFIKEEPYEWGSVGTEPLLKVMLCMSPMPAKPGSLENNQALSKQKKLKSCANAASYWRKKGGKAFENWKVIFYPDSWEKAVTFKKIIVAGGGHVYSSISSAPHTEVTHAFHKSKTDKNLPPNFTWYPIDYLSEYLIERISNN